MDRLSCIHSLFHSPVTHIPTTHPRVYPRARHPKKPVNKGSLI
jgi:hypothetical protein